MTAEAALLAEIWKHPTDREALAVYADWLAQHACVTLGRWLLACSAEVERRAEESVV